MSAEFFEKKSDVLFDFKEKKFLVVGASSGMGRQVTKEILACGGTVLAIARDEERLESLKKQTEGALLTASVDVRDQDRLEEKISEFTNSFGRINGSVYTAGISRTTVLRSFDKMEANTVMDINYWGWINLMNIICTRKYSQEGASHVVIASVSAHTGEAGSFAYNASKAAIISSVKTFAKELSKRKSRVNSVSPGFIETALTEGYFEKRGFSEQTISRHMLGLGAPEDVSGLILYLLSERAKWITGSDFVIDGGYLFN